jgi:hypothetical protein
VISIVISRTVTKPAVPPAVLPCSWLRHSKDSETGAIVDTVFDNRKDTIIPLQPIKHSVFVALKELLSIPTKRMVYNKDIQGVRSVRLVVIVNNFITIA